MLVLNFFFFTFLVRILIYLIRMTGEIEVHEPLHSYNTGHVSEQYVGNSAENSLFKPKNLL